MWKFYIIAALAVSLSSCSGITHDDSLPEVEAEVYAVYSRLIEEMYLREGIKLVVIKDHTVEGELSESRLFQIAEHDGEAMPRLGRGVIGDFNAKNGESRGLKKLFKLNVEYVIINDKEREEVFSNAHPVEGWKAFYERYPASNGIISFSRVGFDCEMNQALVYVEHSYGSLAAAGTYVLLQKKNGVWTVQRKFGVWVS